MSVPYANLAQYLDEVYKVMDWIDETFHESIHFYVLMALFYDPRAVMNAKTKNTPMSHARVIDHAVTLEERCNNMDTVSFVTNHSLSPKTMESYVNAFRLRSIANTFVRARQYARTGGQALNDRDHHWIFYSMKYIPPRTFV